MSTGLYGSGVLPGQSVGKLGLALPLFQAAFMKLPDSPEVGDQGLLHRLCWTRSTSRVTRSVGRRTGKPDVFHVQRTAEPIQRTVGRAQRAG